MQHLQTCSLCRHFPTTDIMTTSLPVAVAALLLLTSPVWCWKCDVHETVCEVWLELAKGLTMMKEKTLVVVKNGSLVPYNTDTYSAGQAIPKDEVITGDGWPEPRVVIMVNGTVPGPVIEVHEGQTVRVHLHNKMLSEATSMHFHGLYQRQTPWMDGVSFVSQCPVLPGQTFVHEFKAEPAGSFWYHSHQGGQTEMGQYGAFVVHPSQGADPKYHKQFTALLQDWNHDWDSTMGFLKMQYGMYVHGRKEAGGVGESGVRYSAFHIQSILINGKGRYMENITSPDNGAPLTTFVVRPNEVYRFRLIHSGTVYPFQVSVDGHPLKVVATDGIELKTPILADSVILTPGERYDFELVANNTEKKSYWFRVTTLEMGNKHIGKAILQYEGAPDNTDPSTEHRPCTCDKPCIVVNCPFQNYPVQTHHQCVNVEKLRSAEQIPYNIGRGATKVKEYFLNFAFPGTTWTPASVNGIQMALPTVSALTQPLQVDSRCPGEGYRCEEDTLCTCTAVLDLNDGEVVQLVMIDMGNGKGWDHPIHMHGHSFWVLKVGYPHYDNVTGLYVSENMDVDCRGNPDRDLSFCNNATWANSSWSGNEVPGLELDFPVRKDTVNVPTGGYVVIRVQANNPGLWPLHCHVSLHLADGMFLLLNESYPLQPPPPPGFPQCSDFRL